MAGDRSEARSRLTGRRRVLSRRLRWLIALTRLTTKRRLARTATAAEGRRNFERTARLLFRAPPFSLRLPAALPGPAGPGTLPAERLSCGAGTDRAKIILYLHGGALVAGSSRTHGPLILRISALCGVPVLAPNYRLAPEHPFPAALQDARAAWDHLHATGYDPEDIVIGGDSAGGGLALALLAELCAEGCPPAGVFALSPWADLTGRAAALRENAERDAMLPAARLVEMGALYLHGAAAEDPRASAVFARFPSPPPVLLQCAETEILRDDSLRMAEVLRAAGGEVVLQRWPDAPHCWQVFDGWVPEARDALEQLALFVRARLHPAPPPEPPPIPSPDPPVATGS